MTTKERTMAEAFAQAAVVVGNPRHLANALMQEFGCDWIKADDVVDAQLRKSGFSTMPNNLTTLAAFLRECGRACQS